MIRGESISLSVECEGVALTNACSRLNFLYGLVGISLWIYLYIQSGLETGSDLFWIGQSWEYKSSRDCYDIASLNGD